MDGIVAYILSKKFTKDTVIGMGAIKGAACQVQSINKVGKTTTITLKWEDNLGGVHTQSFDVEDGADGVSVTGATINASGHLILTLSDTNTIDCGQVLPQYNTMPTPSASNEGQILQYIGTTTSSFTNGYFYICESDGLGGYHWVQKSVQDSYTKTEIGDLTNLPDNTKNVVQNINEIKLSVDQLSASKLSISDIDDTLSENSENPVQNKVIKLTIDQLRGSILDALADKEDRFRFAIMPNASDYVGKMVQYIGTTDTSYTKGYFYESIEVSAGVYNWIQKNVQPSGGGTGGDGVVDGYYKEADHLFYEESTYINPIAGASDTLYVSIDTNLVYRYNGLIFIRVDESSSGENDVIDGYYKEADGKFYEEPTYVTEIIGQTGKIYISDDTNVQYRWDGTQFVTISSSINIDNALSTISENPVQNKVITARINDLQASKLSLSDVDNALSGTSLYPVQNKVISLKIDQLQGSILEKIQKKLSATADDFVVFTNDGDIEDSGISKDVVPLTASASNKLLVASDLSPYQEKLTDGNGINIDGSNNISLDIPYLTASRVGYIPATEKGANDGVAELDTHGKVPSSQLPSYVDDVIDGYLYNDTHFYKEEGTGGYYNTGDNQFYKDSGYTDLIIPVVNDYYLDIPTGDIYQWNGTAYVTPATAPTRIIGEGGVIYISVDSNIQYRWTGTAFAALGGALQLGETSTTAYRGDRGKIAYDHSQITDGSNPHNTTADNVNLKVPIPALSGSKLDVESTLHGIDTELNKKQPIQLVTPITMLSGTKLEVEPALQGLNTEKQNQTLSVPIDTLGGTKLTVEDTLNEFNTEIKAIDEDIPYQKEIAIVGSTTTTTYKNVYIKISGIPTSNNSSTKAISLLLSTRSSRYILNINPYYNSNSLRILQAIDLSRASDTPMAAKIVDLAYEFSDTTAVGTMDVWLKIYLNAHATRLNFSDISDINIPYDIVSLGNDNDIYDVSTSTTNSDYFDTLIKGIISNVAYVNEVNDKLSYADNSILGAKNFLLNDAVTTTTAQGVTYVVNNDKTVSVASGQTMSTYTNLSLGSVILPEGDYILNGCPSGGGANTYRLRLVNGSTLLGIDSGEGYSFHADGNTNYTVTVGLSANGVSYTVPTDLLFKPMIRLASDTDDTYVLYAMTNAELTKCVTWKDV